MGEAGINLRGVSANVIGTRFVMHLALDSEADAEHVLDMLGSKHKAATPR